MAKDSYMSYVTRDQIVGSNGQKLTTFDWDFKITKSANDEVYSPGEQLTKARISSITGIPFMPEYQGNLPTEIRGFKMIQPGFTNNYGGQCTITIEDFEDQSMTAFIMDWLWKCNNPANHASYHKKQLAWDKLELFRLNSSREPVFKVTLYTVLPGGAGSDMSFTSDKQLQGQIQLSLDYEYFDSEFLNVNS
jgi:hypothetical protein